MSVMLELYLEEVKQQLKSLPKSQRETELREIAGHLDALIQAHQADGMLYGDAVSAAMRQFGCPHRVGGGLSRAWQQRHGERPLRVLAAAGAVLVCQIALLALCGGLSLLARTASAGGYGPPLLAEHCAPLLDGAAFLTPLAAGLLAQTIAPRRVWWSALVPYCVWSAALIALMLSYGEGASQSLQTAASVFLFLPGVAFGVWWGQRRSASRDARQDASPSLLAG